MRTLYLLRPHGTASIDGEQLVVRSDEQELDRMGLQQWPLPGAPSTLGGWLSPSGTPSGGAAAGAAPCLGPVAGEWQDRQWARGIATADAASRPPRCRVLPAEIGSAAIPHQPCPLPQSFARPGGIGGSTLFSQPRRSVGARWFRVCGAQTPATPHTI